MVAVGKADESAGTWKLVGGTQTFCHRCWPAPSVGLHRRDGALVGKHPYGGAVVDGLVSGDGFVVLARAATLDPDGGDV